MALLPSEIDCEEQQLTTAEFARIAKIYEDDLHEPSEYVSNLARVVGLGNEMECILRRYKVQQTIPKATTTAGKMLYPNLHTPLSIGATLPVTSAVCERPSTLCVS